jgi:hypothetical protein
MHPFGAEYKFFVSPARQKTVESRRATKQAIPGCDSLAQKVIRQSIASIFLAGLLVSSATAQKDGNDGVGLPTFGTTVVVPFGLAGDLYYLPPDTTILPNFDKLVPVGRIYTNKLNIPTRDFTSGFPGLTSRIEWFGIDYNGRFWVENPGKYTFSLLSDDGSRLYIDDTLEIDNDGIHAAVLIAGAVKLKRGIHRIRIDYFQGPRYQLALVLSVQPPGGKWKIFNTDDFKPPSNTDSWSEADRKALEELQQEPLRKLKKSGKELAAEEGAMEKLKSATLPRDFEFRGTVLQFPRGEKDGKTNLTVAYEVPLASLRPKVDQGAEIRVWRFVLIAVIRDAEGKLVDEMRTDVPFAAPEGRAKTVAGRYFTYARNFSVKAGKYRIILAVLDRESGNLAGEATDIESGASQGGVSLSSLVMVDHTQRASAPETADPLVYQGVRLVPMLSRTIAPDEERKIYILAKADAGAPEKPALEIELLVDGKLAGMQVAPMPEPDEGGLIRMSFVAPVRAGHCELRLTAVQGASRATESIAYEVATAR